MAENTPHGWLHAHPDLLDRFAADLDVLADELEDIRSDQSDLAAFLSPSTDPATVRIAARLAEDGQDRDGTPVHEIAKTIADLRAQAFAARMAARDYRAAEETTGARMRAIEEDPT
jgi:hypothetical protein